MKKITLIIPEGYDQVIGDFDSKMKWWQAGSGVIKNEYVTHWMPLPSTEGLDDAT